MTALTLRPTSSLPPGAWISCRLLLSFPALPTLAQPGRQLGYVRLYLMGSRLVNMDLPESEAA